MTSSTAWILVYIVMQLTFSTPPAQAGGILLIPLLARSHISQLRILGETLTRRGHSRVDMALPANSRYRHVLQHSAVDVLSFGAAADDVTGDAATASGTADAEGPRPGAVGLEEFAENAHAQAFADPLVTWQGIQQVAAANMRQCDVMLHDVAFLGAIKANAYDVAIVDTPIFGYCFHLLPYHLGIPSIGLSSDVIDWDVGLVNLPSFSSDVFFPWNSRQTLLQKLANLAVKSYVSSDFNALAQNYTLLKKFAPTVHTWRHLVASAHLFIVTRDHVLEDADAQMPHIITLPTLNVSPGRRLDDGMTSRLSPNKNTIVVSFGSMDDAFPREYIQMLTNVFSQLRHYTVIWKTTTLVTTTAAEQPKLSHIHRLAWLPQNDLLAHPRTKLFISHCGSGGVYEALYHGVPILCIPLYAEQPHNAAMVESKGYGKQLMLVTATERETSETINYILSNRQIQAAVLKASQLLKDRPLAPREEAAYWVEHIMKFGGQHLRPATMDMPLYEMFCLDILAIIGCIVLIILILICACTRFSYRCIFGGKQANKPKRD